MVYRGRLSLGKGVGLPFLRISVFLRISDFIRILVRIFSSMIIYSRIAYSISLVVVSMDSLLLLYVCDKCSPIPKV